MRETFKFEKEMQPQADRIYKSWGWEVASRAGTQQYDAIVHSNGNIFRVEEKFRTDVYEDLLVELLQDIPSFERGWAYHCDAHWLTYFMCKDNSIVRTYCLEWDSFKGWFVEWLNGERFPTALVTPKHYGLTLNVAVPLKDIPLRLFMKRSDL